ncbi:MAG: hypothetical protein ACOYI5_05875 [Christensenellales bacterium]|jgi:hypothetical protein
MKIGFLVKLILGILLIALLVLLGYRLVDTIAGMVGNLAGGGQVVEEDGDYLIPTTEPMPTMPAHMQEDSFYDDAGRMDYGD